MTILYSDRSIFKTYSYMNGYGSHTHSMTNDKNERVCGKFYFKTMQGALHLFGMI